MLCRLLAESDCHFLHPAEFENVANPDFENLKHLQNPGHLPMAESSRCTDSHVPKNNHVTQSQW